jgi:hypothetical protein
MHLTFIETPIFTKEIIHFLPDEQYRQLQWELLFRPEAGNIIPGAKGFRKIRWSLPGSGKRGSLRIIYYFDKPDVIYMLFPYKKNRQENLTNQQLKYLSAIMKEYLK